MDEVFRQIDVVFKSGLLLDKEKRFQFIRIEGLQVIPRNIPVQVESRFSGSIVKHGRGI